MKSTPTLFCFTLLALAWTVFSFDPRTGSDVKNGGINIPGRGEKKSLPRRILNGALNYDPADAEAHLLNLREDNVATSQVEPSAGCQKCESVLHFSTKASQDYAVGTDIPTLSLKTKNSWAGLIPVTVDKKDTFYMWMWANDGPRPSEDVVIWLNGGPGCSSLYGMVIENGPFLYPSKKAKPYANPHSWTKEAIMVYVEMPIGVGFSTGKVTDLNEVSLAVQFATFLDNFFSIFPELKGKKLYIAGESYAGIYMNYIMNHQYDLGNKHNLQGGMAVSGLMSSRVAQGDLVAYDFAVKWAHTLELTKDDLAAVKKQSDQCGYTDYLEKNLIYPPRGRLPPINLDSCDTIHTLYNKSGRNPSANPYRVTVPDPLTDDPLGNPFAETQDNDFFDNAELQDYINAPRQKWNLCTVDRVYTNGVDASAPPDQAPSYSHSLLAKTIERSPAGLMMLTGRQDMVVLTEGTSLVLQNLTWNNAQGFQAKPSKPLLDSQGKSVGVWAKERGLTYVIFDNAGHSIPSDAPETALLALQVMLGRRVFPQSTRLSLRR